MSRTVGDRLALYRGPNGETIVVLISAWDSIGDAQEFTGAVAAMADATGRRIAMSESGTRVAIAMASTGAQNKVDAALDFDLSAIDLD